MPTQIPNISGVGQGVSSDEVRANITNRQASIDRGRGALAPARKAGRQDKRTGAR